jgi:hypothetical protein
VSGAAGALLALVRCYQRVASPLLGARCRFLPSCSDYAAMAVEEWGAVRGAWLATRRVLRCHPLHPAGLDLPPRRIAAGLTGKPAAR